jgi:hypothetical protein
MIFHPLSCERGTEIVMFLPFLNFWRLREIKSGRVFCEGGGEIL